MTVYTVRVDALWNCDIENSVKVFILSKLRDEIAPVVLLNQEPLVSHQHIHFVLHTQPSQHQLNSMQVSAFRYLLKDTPSIELPPCNVNVELLPWEEE